jgi:hypothetical protein
MILENAIMECSGKIKKFLIAEKIQDINKVNLYNYFEELLSSLEGFLS